MGGGGWGLDNIPGRDIFSSAIGCVRMFFYARP